MTREAEPTSDQPVSEVARALKRLRSKSGLSIAKMAKELGMTSTGYQHYEDRYKKDRFPQDFLHGVVGALRKHGVPEEELAELGLLADFEGASSAELKEEMRLMNEKMNRIVELMERRADAK